MTVQKEMLPLVIGVGNIYRGDDALGLLVLQGLATLSGVRLAEWEGEGTILLELWKDSPFVILVDAVCSGRPPGTIYRFDLSKESLPAEIFKTTSTHSIGIAEAVALGQIFNSLPPQLIIYGVEASQFEMGADLSPEVWGALEPLIEKLKADLAQFGADTIQEKSK